MPSYEVINNLPYRRVGSHLCPPSGAQIPEERWANKRAHPTLFSASLRLCVKAFSFLQSKKTQLNSQAFFVLSKLQVVRVLLTHTRAVHSQAIAHISIEVLK